MRAFLFFSILFCTQLFPQLKELEVKPTENRGGIPIFRDHPDKAGIIFYTQFDDLKFYSSYGIVDIKGDPAGGKYVVIIEPVRQTIEVRAPGYKTEMIRLNDLQPRDVLYYEVLPKKEEGISEVSEVGVTIQATPQDAIIKLDGATIANDRITLVSVGKHTLIVEKPGYNSYSSIIEVTPQNTLFKVTLTSDDPSKVVVSTMPEGAEIFIDGISKGKTRKAFFLYPGTYDLRLFMQGYLQINERINVSKDELKNEFTFNLQKNTGNLILSVSPAFATVRINKEVVDDSQMLELAPGTYQIEVEADTYLPFKGTVNLQLGETKTERISLVQKTGKLQFTINPPEAECVLSLNGVDKYRWTGLKILNSIAAGTYLLTAKAKGYKTHSVRISIRENETTFEEVELQKEVQIKKEEAIAQVFDTPTKGYNDLGETFVWLGFGGSLGLPSGVMTGNVETGYGGKLLVGATNTKHPLSFVFSLSYHEYSFNQQFVKTQVILSSGKYNYSKADPFKIVEIGLTLRYSLTSTDFRPYFEAGFFAGDSTGGVKLSGSSDKVIPESPLDFFKRRHFTYSFGAGFDFSVTDKLGLFAGVSHNIMVREGGTNLNFTYTGINVGLRFSLMQNQKPNAIITNFR